MSDVTQMTLKDLAAAIMRRAVMLASAYAAERETFGRKLEEHPLHREVLGQMAAEADGALYLTMRMAQLLGRIEAGTAGAAELALTPISAQPVRSCMGQSLGRSSPPSSPACLLSAHRFC